RMGSRRNRRRRRSRIDEAAGAIDQQINQSLGPADVSSGAAKRLAQRAHLDVHLARKIEIRDEPAAVMTDNSDRMRFIEKEQRSKAVFQRDDLAQWRPVSVHAEDGFR